MRPFLRRSSKTTSPHSTIWLQHAKKTEKVKKFSLCLRSGNINSLMQAFEQTFEITVNTIFHYLPFTHVCKMAETNYPRKDQGEKAVGRREGEQGGGGCLHSAWKG